MNYPRYASVILILLCSNCMYCFDDIPDEIKDHIKKYGGVIYQKARTSPTDALQYAACAAYSANPFTSFIGAACLGSKVSDPILSALEHKIKNKKIRGAIHKVRTDINTAKEKVDKAIAPVVKKTAKLVDKVKKTAHKAKSWSCRHLHIGC